MNLLKSCYRKFRRVMASVFVQCLHFHSVFVKFALHIYMRKTIFVNLTTISMSTTGKL